MNIFGGCNHCVSNSRHRENKTFKIRRKSLQLVRTEVKWCQSPSTVYRAQDERNGNGEVKNGGWWRETSSFKLSNMNSYEDGNSRNVNAMGHFFFSLGFGKAIGFGAAVSCWYWSAVVVKNGKLAVLMQWDFHWSGLLMIRVNCSQVYRAFK